nr:hypothetical protein Itr_chr11CG20930 [Ipomoea trifida]
MNKQIPDFLSKNFSTFTSVYQTNQPKTLLSSPSTSSFPNQENKKTTSNSQLLSKKSKKKKYATTQWSKTRNALLLAERFT